MAMWFGLVYIFSMCFVVGRGHAVFVQNARLKDTLCPEYTFNGHRSSIVRCGRLCASNATCRAFFFDITSSDCYVIDTAVAVTNACVFKPGHLYEGDI
ncbi:hypothetical protein DPMN_141610 [Dreissena polymorpha]|uniref:Apple domain-containing protein n=1 Tax=Dreissena polymorpha TaxID=45954 RepID=A0A9D4G9T1_DREPO|nr:hypothetical protein DPMN_141610 [Dreissena polymorpha]